MLSYYCIYINERNRGMSSLNIQSIIVNDAVGVVLLIIILVTKGWSLPARKKESYMLLGMILVSITNCIADAVVACFDGKPGTLSNWIAYAGNTYLYLYNLIIGIGVIYIISKHIDKVIYVNQVIFFTIITSLEVVLLIINFFKPVVFKISSENVYHRETLYYLYVVAGFGLIIYGYMIYLYGKLKSASVRYFPAWQFLLPILLSAVTQTLMYGISLQPVSFAIAFSAMVICLQNECRFIDKLTGVYNRYELDKLQKSFIKKRKERVGAIMIDMNDFKSINDNYSHTEGDNALVEFADILTNSIKTEGVVIRFAGDEFVVILRRFKSESLDPYIESIRNALNERNNTSKKPYKLSAAIGGDIFDYKNVSEGDFMKHIDALMYKDKDDYYAKTGNKRR